MKALVLSLVSLTAFAQSQFESTGITEVKATSDRKEYSIQGEFKLALSKSRFKSFKEAKAFCESYAMKIAHHNLVFSLITRTSTKPSELESLKTQFVSDFSGKKVSGFSGWMTGPEVRARDHKTMDMFAWDEGSFEPTKYNYEDFSSKFNLDGLPVVCTDIGKSNEEGKSVDSSDRNMTPDKDKNSGSSFQKAAQKASHQ